MGVDPADPTVHVGGVDVGEAIRETAISAAVSAVATNLEVRAELGRLQRAAIDEARSGGRGSSPRAATSRPWSRPTPTCACC